MNDITMTAISGIVLIAMLLCLAINTILILITKKITKEFHKAESERVEIKKELAIKLNRLTEFN